METIDCREPTALGAMMDECCVWWLGYVNCEGGRIEVLLYRAVEEVQAQEHAGLHDDIGKLVRRTFDWPTRLRGDPASSSTETQ